MALSPTSSRGSSGGSLPAWWTVVSTAGSENLRLGGTLEVIGASGNNNAYLSLIGQPIANTAYSEIYHTFAGTTSATVWETDFNDITDHTTWRSYFQSAVSSAGLFPIVFGWDTHGRAWIGDNYDPDPTARLSVWVAGGNKWGIKEDGAEYLNALTAPADGDVATGQRLQWYDDTTGAPVLRFKEKDAAGTLASGVSLASSGHQATVGSAGAAAALPATPTEYLKVRDTDGNLFVIPAYAAA